MIKNSFAKRSFLLVLLSFGFLFPVFSAPAFKAIMWAVPDQWHFFMNDAKAYIQQLGAQYNFQADYSEDLTKHTDAFLSQYQLYINLNIEVTPLTDPQKAAFENFINSGKGWVGIHMAGINKATWDWYDAFLGGTRFVDHPTWVHAWMNVEDRTHPASVTLPARWQVWDECYEFNKSPRASVRVLASLDEKTYTPKNPMGDHPIIWCNENYKKTIYIGIGHSDSMWTREQNFRNLVRDAMLWAGQAATKTVNAPVPDAAAALVLRRSPRAVSFSLPAKQYTAIVTDATGRMIVTRATANGTCCFDRGLFSGGVYFIHAVYGSGNITTRIVLP